MRSYIIATATVLIASLAISDCHAETQRQRHLPYIRAASDCIANSVRRDYGFREAVKSNIFRPLIVRAYASCTFELQRMVVTHNEIYGGGGEQFLTVDYDADIERAVRTRLGTVIVETQATMSREAEQQAAAEAQAKAARIEADNRAKVAMAEKQALAKRTQELVRDKMFSCIGREASTMMLTNESAEVVAKAAMIFCRSDVDAMSVATGDVISADSDTPVNGSLLRQQAEISVRELVTAYVVKARGNMLSSKSNLNPPADQLPTVTKNF